MRRWIMMLVLLWSAGAIAADNGIGRLVVLSYHDVREVRGPELDPYTIEAAELVNQFAWLKEHGYRPVSLQQIVAAARGGPPLPDKPVLLTFDDGYRSFYTLVYPLLRLYDYPALLALVGSWLEDRQAGTAAAPAHAALLDWEQIRALSASGLVEIASHSYDLHRGLQANPQGNELAAAATRRYDAGRVESDADYLHRVRADLARNAALIERETGHRPRAMVWPYGAYNGETERLTRELGMPVSVSLDRHSAFGQAGIRLGRVLIQGNPSLPQFAAEMLRPYPPTLLRGAHVDLGAVFDADPARQEENLSRLIDRIAALGLNTVYLSAFHDGDGDGRIDAVYFPTAMLPVRANLLGRAAWQLHSRAQVKVFAWLPLFGLQTGSTGMRSLDAAQRHRIITLYQDLGRQAPVDGLLFRDEPAAGEAQGYDAFVADLLVSLSAQRAPLATARSMGLRAAVDPKDSAQASDELKSALRQYDQVLIRAAPATPAQQRWLAAFARALPSQDKGVAIFDLPSDHGALSAILHRLQLEGIGNLSYGPDEFRRNHPPLADLRPVISGQSEAR